MHGRNRRLGRCGDAEGSCDRRQERALHRRRILSPMKSEVECTFGFSRTRVATGTPAFVEITPKVSPAWTIQNRRPAAAFFVVTVRATVVELCPGEVATCTVIDPRESFPPASSPEWINTIAIVAASKNAPGAA